MTHFLLQSVHTSRGFSRHNQRQKFSGTNHNEHEFQQSHEPISHDRSLRWQTEILFQLQFCVSFVFVPTLLTKSTFLVVFYVIAVMIKQIFLTFWAVDGDS